MGVVLGLVAGGKVSNLAHARLRGEWLLFIALVLQALLPTVRSAGVARDVVYSVWLGSFFVLLAVCLANCRHPGLSIAGVGMLLNTVVIALNGGMPVAAEALTVVKGTFASGLSSTDFAHVVLTAATRAAALADVMPVPGPTWLRSIASAGDLMLCCGVATYVAYAMRTLPVVARSSDAGLSVSVAK
ncbi:MAG: DUF5317 family protein [Coriobacteriia bacterium]|nr:DUF5317 family protein [Coriobacteriia bacterium]